MTFMTTVNWEFLFFSILDLNIASLLKYFEDLNNFLSWLKHSFGIIGITEHKINKKMNIDFKLPGYVFCYNETESSHGGTSIFVMYKLTFNNG